MSSSFCLTGSVTRFSPVSLYYHFCFITWSVQQTMEHWGFHQLDEREQLYPCPSSFLFMLPGKFPRTIRNPSGVIISGTDLSNRSPYLCLGKAFINPKLTRKWSMTIDQFELHAPPFIQTKTSNMCATVGGWGQKSFETKPWLFWQPWNPKLHHRVRTLSRCWSHLEPQV